jgi:hypothetical protein
LSRAACWAADSTRVPAWDDRQVLLVSGDKRGSPIALFSQEKLQAFLVATMGRAANASEPVEHLPTEEAGQRTAGEQGREAPLRKIEFATIEGPVWRGNRPASALSCRMTGRRRWTRT